MILIQCTRSRQLDSFVLCNSLTESKAEENKTEEQEINYYKFDMDNKLDSDLFFGLVKNNINQSVSADFVAFIRLFQFVQKSLNEYATINSIIDTVKFNYLNGSRFPHYYTSKRGIREVIDCLAVSQKRTDYEHIAASKFISMCEDAQLVQKVSARGFIINCWDQHRA